MLRKNDCQLIRRDVEPLQPLNLPFIHKQHIPPAQQILRARPLGRPHQTLLDLLPSAAI